MGKADRFPPFPLPAEKPIFLKIEHGVFPAQLLRGFPQVLGRRFVDWLC
ncbi:hypothetical protein KBY58_01575 [Cyanobium sp. HWJ4-Hawea]|nr:MULTISPECIES: hypothetical protein [unclassified Cyanobium]MCP9775548.1 hypothetical protein [Cyanobium sp. WAJ14-Wanaka]MCP9808122.1 hypothetical protein [Cyanobium sp. HWJ4-Hawea]